MTDATRAPSSPTRRLAELLAGAELRALSRSLFGAAYERAHVALPRLLDAGAMPPSMRGPGVLIETMHAGEDAGRSIAIGLPPHQALGLVDRMLGGRGQGFQAPAEPSPAECGVLAYAAARMLALLAPELRLRDVHLASREALSARVRDHVLWLLWLEGEAGELALPLILSRSAARALALSFTVQLALSDALAAEALEGLAPGAVLVSDRWTLSATTEGWAGPVEVLVPEAENHVLRGLLERGVVTCSADRGQLEPAQVVLVLAERQVSLHDLAAIGAGELPAFTDVQPGAARLVRGAERVAEGRLAVHQGALAFVVTRCGSAASPGHPHG